jgi:hypothetical protein
MGAVDLVKEHRTLYTPPAKHAVIVDVPEMRFLMLDGRGDPNTAPAYQEALQALYSIAYTLKFTLRKSAPERDFKVPPLEGLWWTEEEHPSTDAILSSMDLWQWTMMIALPGEVTAIEMQAAASAAARKRDNGQLSAVRLESFAEGLAAQIMHVGPYADEAPTVERLHAFVAEQGYVLAGRHHEIYLGDPRRTAPERLKTVLRHPIRDAATKE